MTEPTKSMVIVRGDGLEPQLIIRATNKIINVIYCFMQGF